MWWDGQDLIPGADWGEAKTQLAVPLCFWQVEPRATLQVLREEGVLNFYSRWHIKGSPRPKSETPGDSESHFLDREMTASLFLHTGGRLLLSLVGKLP